MTTPEPRRARILIADDDPAVLDALALVLDLQGYEVTAVAGAYEALEALRPGRFDLLLCDLNLPGMSGLELVREARRRAPDLRCVLMTGVAADVAATRAAEAGVAEVVTKPLTLRELAPVLARVLQAPPG